MPAELSQVELLNSTHELLQFDCGKHPSLNDWLRRFALSNQRSDGSRTFVVHRSNRVVGYYSIAAGSVLREEAPTRIGKGLPNQPIPVAVLGRLAVDQSEQGTGLGSALLKDALSRISQAADSLAIRAVLVHAIDEDAARFYERFDFERSPAHPLHLLLLMKDLRNSLR